jgi:hypothetical protein
LKEIAILLTGTVRPNEMAFTKLLDPALRRAQYVASLNDWLNRTSLPIVFVENSGVDISSDIDNEHVNRIEFLTFSGNDYRSDLGKGYGEMNCLQYAAENSLVLKKCGFVFKVTGRLKMLNFDKFLDYCLRKDNLFVFLDLRDSLRFADSRFFGFHPEFLNRYLLQYRSEVNDSSGRFFEHVLAKATLIAVSDGKRFEQLPYYPRLAGVSGTANQPYNATPLFSFTRRIKYFFKSWLMSRP